MTADAATSPLLNPDELHPLEEVNEFREIEREHDADVKRVIADATRVRTVKLEGGPYDGETFTTSVIVMPFADPDQLNILDYDGSTPVIVHRYHAVSPVRAVYQDESTW